MPYGDEWRDHSRIFHRFFNPRVTKTYVPRIDREVKATLVRLARTPEHFFEHFRQYVESSYHRHAYDADNGQKDGRLVDFVDNIWNNGPAPRRSIHSHSRERTSSDGGVGTGRRISWYAPCHCMPRMNYQIDGELCSVDSFPACNLFHNS